MIKKLQLLLLPIFLTGCMGYPKSVKPVEDFKIEGYMGTWYEIARLDHSFERGLENVTAEYSLQDNGEVRVKNRGYSQKDKLWEQATGKARFAKNANTGYLKVSFFGPFYGSYVIFDLDDDEYSFVCGPNTSYLWFLARNPVVPNELKRKFITKTQKLGFESKDLIWVNQQENNK